MAQPDTSDRLRKSIARLDVTMTLVTPAFTGRSSEATESSQAEVRLPAVLGPLRFWWRALAWSRTTGTEAERLEELHAWESRLFGSAEVGIGLFTASLRPKEVIESDPWSTRSSSSNDKPEEAGYLQRLGGYSLDHSLDARRKAGLTYLAGQGLVKASKKGNFDQRPSVPAGSTYSITFLARTPHKRSNEGREPGDAQFDASWLTNLRVFAKPSLPGAPSVADALMALHLFGGIGSRSRRGFGSVMFTRTEGSAWAFPSIQKDVEDLIRHLRSDNMVQAETSNPPVTKPFSVIAGHTGAGATPILLIKSNKEAIVSHFHADIGIEFLMYRGYGYRDKKTRNYCIALETRSLQLFKYDHDWLHDILDANGQNPIFSSKEQNHGYSGLAYKNGVLVAGASGVSIARAGGEAPVRVVFGLPSAYQSTTHPNSGGCRIEIKPGASEFDRRASPLMLKILKTGETVAGLWFVLHSRFLPEESASSPQLHLSVTRVDKTPGTTIKTVIGNIPATPVERKVLDNFLSFVADRRAAVTKDGKSVPRSISISSAKRLI